MAPLIGVTTSEVRRGDLATLRRHGEPPQHEMALGLTYMRAVELAGGVPVVLPPLEQRRDGDAARRVSTASACPAGPTSTPPPTAPAPTSRSARPSPRSTASSSSSRAPPTPPGCRCSASAAAPRRSTSPAAARCTSTSRTTARSSSRPGPCTRCGSPAGSLAARVLGTRSTQVNSFHHQACDALGDGLVATAWAPDGTIEAIEDRSHPFLLGVQWHAETLIDDDGAARAVPRARRRRERPGAHRYAGCVSRSRRADRHHPRPRRAPRAGRRACAPRPVAASRASTTGRPRRSPARASR